MTAPIVVFLGPTLSLADAERELPATLATYRGPVAQGDVLRAVERRPAAIAIIDGYFASVPAVWHKEILWALSQGVRVYGASSMGALRAAELHGFGMVGVGKIFEAFRDGEYEDDDEVTIIHGDADSGYQPLSVAMVDLRATFRRAVDEQVIDAATGAALLAHAKDLPYAERSYAAALAAIEREGGEARTETLVRLRAWLPLHRVAQKRLDAIELLRTLRHRVEVGTLDDDAAAPSFRFEHTDAWEQLAQRSGHRQTTSPLDPRVTQPLLDELRLGAPGAYQAALDGALMRSLVTDEARRHEVTVGEELLGEAARAFFLRKATLTPEQIQSWMAAEQLDETSLTRFLTREAKLHWARTLYAADALAHLPDHLRATGELIPLLARARAKRQLPAAANAGFLVEQAEALLAWLFARRGVTPPGDADACAQMLGFESGERLLQAIALERRWLERVGASDD
jgi:hypothetical protein